MIEVKDAQRAIETFVLDCGVEEVPIEKARGRVLACDIKSQRPGPPFDRVAMDGIGVVFKSLQSQDIFRCQGMQAAGLPQMELDDKNSCMEVMTGAVLPKNCDTVIPFEHIIEKDGCYCVCKNIQTKLGQNIHRCGSDYPKGEVLLNEGYVINAPAVAVLASEGVEKVLVKKNPRFAIITTGSELVPITSMPEPHQIRMSNVYTALPCLSHFGIDQIDRYHLEDDKQTMKIKMSELLKNYDVLILSGGVSKGKKDHVPDVLNELGVEKVFHRIAQKPGKPMFFGTLQSKCVFALPGNPVSMLVCMSRYIIPWLKKNLGILSDKQECVALNNGIKPKEKLVLFSPVKVNIDEFGVRKADTIKVNGSGDFNSLTESDGFVEVPKGNSEVSSGTLLHYYPWS